MTRLIIALLTSCTVFYGQESPLVIESPLDYQVFQRDTKLRGTIVIRGRSERDCDAAQFRIDPKSPWQSLKVDAGKCSFQSESRVDAGSWRRLEIRVLKGGKPVAEANVDHVGLGEVFVIAGQSNSTNYGEARQQTASGMVGSFGGSSWVVANDPQPGVQDSSRGGSFIPAFGDALYATYNVPIGVASVGFGGTSVRQWLPKGDRFNVPPTAIRFVREVGRDAWESDGTLFETMMLRIQQLGRGGFRALLWHQGESDANQRPDRQITPEQYREYMVRLIRGSRTRAGWDFPWIVAQATYHTPDVPASPAIRDAQKSLWTDGIAFEGPDTDTLTGDNRQNGGKGVHFSAKGLQAHGQMWAGKVSAWLDRTSLKPVGREYFQLRGGLRNALSRFAAGPSARVAFLGGSITQGGGWRDMVCAELEKRFPRTKFECINAGISSTGSTPGAFRLLRDVFGKGPVDLLFEEAAVNDDTNAFPPREQLRGMEGIVRHSLEVNPNLDIVLLHFVDPGKIKTIREGHTPEVIAIHERVSAHYGLPSIDLAREITERIDAGEFTWEKDFIGLHPAPFGHRIYANSISRLLDAASSDRGEVRPHSLPSPLDEKSYFRGRLEDIARAVRGDGWELNPDWAPAERIGTRAGFVHVPMLTAEKPGASCRFSFEGTAVGIFVAAGPDAGIVEYSIDGGPFQKQDLFTQWSPALHIPWAYVLDADLAPGKHELTMRVAGQANPGSKGHAIRIVNFLVN